MMFIAPLTRSRKKTKIIIGIIALFICVNMSFLFTNDNSTKDNYDMSINLDILRKTDKPARVHTTETPIWIRDTFMNNSILFENFSKAKAYMKSVTSLENAKTVIIHYSEFSRKIPKFINETDEELFMQSTLNQENLKQVPNEQLRGVIEIVPNGTFKMDYTCGFRSDSDFFRMDRPSEFTKEFDTLVPLVIPMGFLFQHFFDGTFPKIVQAYEYIMRPETKILIEHPNHDNVLRILERLNITHDKVVWHRRNDVRTVYKARYMINTCIAPPIHPELWSKMRSLLGVNDVIKVPANETLVMLLTRAGATNGGRSAMNLNDVYDYLSNRFGSRLVLFDSQFDLKQAMDIFSKVKIIIGTHGGSFYNLNYAPVNTTIIEFVPYDYGGRDIRALPHAIFWAMSNLIGQPYWRVMCKSENYQHDMNIDLNKLESILNIVDKEHM